MKIYLVMPIYVPVTSIYSSQKEQTLLPYSNTCFVIVCNYHNRSLGMSHIMQNTWRLIEVTTMAFSKVGVWQDNKYGPLTTPSPLLVLFLRSSFFGGIRDVIVNFYCSGFMTHTRPPFLWRLFNVLMSEVRALFILMTEVLKYRSSYCTLLF